MTIMLERETVQRELPVFRVEVPRRPRDEESLENQLNRWMGEGGALLPTD